MDSQDTIEPWDQRPSETAKAFRAFTVYRDLGPDRSLLEAFLQSSGRKTGNAKVSDGSRARARVPGHFTRWSSEHEWVARAEAWDRHLDALSRKQAESQYVEKLAEFRDEQLEWAGKANGVLRKATSVVEKALEHITPEKLSGMELSKFLRSMVDLSESVASAKKEALGIDKILEVLEEEGML